MRAPGRRAPAVVALACTVALTGCSKGGGEPAQAEKPLVGGLGKRLAAGPVADLKLTKDGAHATFLRNPKRPAIQGVSPLMALGELGVASLKDGIVRFVGQGVTNRPGSVLFSPGLELAALRRRLQHRRRVRHAPHLPARRSG